jgi:hypothetical protein
MATPNEPEPDIAEQLCRAITSWINRAAPRIRDEMCVAKLEIALSSPGGDDDGRLLLDYTIDETVISDRGSGLVTGQRFDPIPAPAPIVAAAPLDLAQAEADCYRLFDALLDLRRVNHFTSIQLHGDTEARALRSWAAGRGFSIVESADTIELTPPDSAECGWMVVAHLPAVEPPASPAVDPMDEVVF